MRWFAARFSGLAALIVAVALGLSACGSGSANGNRERSGERGGPGREDDTGALAPPATFASLPPGWRQFDDGGARLTSRGGTSETFATSWRFERLSLHGPAGDLPPGGVVVTALLIRRAAGGRPSAGLCRGDGPYPAYQRIRRRPLRLGNASIGELEGSERVAEYRLFRTVRDEYNVEIRVAINQASPGRAFLRTAQTVLGRLKLPHWPTHC